MKTPTFIRRWSVVIAAFSLGCGDSTAPSVNLTEEQVADMLDALSAVSALGTATGPAMSVAPSGASARAASWGPLTLFPGSANVTVTISETVDCPNGGSASANGTATSDEQGNFTAQLTQDFSNCAAPSEQGRVWTFNGDPNIVTNMSASFNLETEAFTMTATQAGGISFTSDIGSGNCQLDLTLTLTGGQDSFSGTLSGTACGRNVQQTVEMTQ